MAAKKDPAKKRPAKKKPAMRVPTAAELKRKEAAEKAAATRKAKKAAADEAAAKKKAAAEKAARTKAARSKPRSTRGKSRPSPTREKAKKAIADGTEKPEAAVPSTRKVGRKLNAAQQSARDSLMIQRLAQDWPWAAIAEEAGMEVASAIRAVQKRQKTAPIPLSMDPVRVIEQISMGYQHSIGDLEAISSRAIQEDEYGAAVTAKKGANDAREKLLTLLQATGRLPQDLSSLRHLMDVREVSTKMIDAVETFRRSIDEATTLPPARRTRAIANAAETVTMHFESLLGFDDQDMQLQAGEVDGTEEVDAEVVSE